MKKALSLLIWMLVLLLPLGQAMAEMALPTEREVQQLASHYYDTQGEWAGKFTIGRFMQIRLDPKSETHVVAHVKYEAELLQAREHRSVDQRTFDLKYREGGWQVVKMGEHQSASF